MGSINTRNAQQASAPIVFPANAPSYQSCQLMTGKSTEIWPTPSGIHGK